MYTYHFYIYIYIYIHSDPVDENGGLFSCRRRPSSGRKSGSLHPKHTSSVLTVIITNIWVEGLKD